MVAIDFLLQTPLIKLTVIWQVKARFFILNYSEMAINLFDSFSANLMNTLYFLLATVNWN
jgi:hypothetical protein